MGVTFQDRVATYPNRYKVTKANGTSEYITLERADVPIVEGTPLNAATLNAAFEGLGGGVSMELLWANASPSSNFAAQTITVAGASEYELFEIFYFTNTKNTYLQKAVLAPYMSTFMEYFSVPTSSGWYTLNLLREVSHNGANNFTFTDARTLRTNVAGEDATIDNAEIIPALIIGVKGLKGVS